MKAKLNIRLLSTLPRVLRMTHAEVSEQSGISIACWYRLVKDPEKITVQQLLGIANGLRIPVGQFFTFGKADIIGVREDYILLTGYQNCYYDSDAVNRRIGEGTATSWRDAAAAVGMHWTNVSSSLLAVSRTPVTRLMTLCEAFNFDLFEFLVDPNKGTHKKRDGRRSYGDSKEQRDDDAESLRSEIATLHGDIKALTATVEELTRKYEDLLERHTKLEHTVNEDMRRPVDVAADT